MEQLFDSFASVLRTLGPNKEIEEALMFMMWGRCAGEMLRSRTRPLEFFEERLIVAVTDETWRRHLEALSPQLVARLNALAGNGRVRFIEFRVDPRSVSPPKVEDRGKTNGTPDIAPSIAAAAETIGSAELRARFLDAAAACLNKS
jgi:hypothetical protein